MGCTQCLFNMLLNLVFIGLAVIIFILSAWLIDKYKPAVLNKPLDDIAKDAKDRMKNETYNDNNNTSGNLSRSDPFKNDMANDFQNPAMLFRSDNTTELGDRGQVIKINRDYILIMASICLVVCVIQALICLIKIIGKCKIVWYIFMIIFAVIYGLVVIIILAKGYNGGDKLIDFFLGMCGIACLAIFIGLLLNLFCGKKFGGGGGGGSGNRNTNSNS